MRWKLCSMKSGWNSKKLGPLFDGCLQPPDWNKAKCDTFVLLIGCVGSTSIFCTWSLTILNALSIIVLNLIMQMVLNFLKTIKWKFTHAYQICKFPGIQICSLIRRFETIWIIVYVNFKIRPALLEVCCPITRHGGNSPNSTLYKRTSSHNALGRIEFRAQVPISSYAVRSTQCAKTHALLFFLFYRPLFADRRCSRVARDPTSLSTRAAPWRA